VFHRIIPTFMIQGGGFDKTLAKKAVKPAIENEADNGLKNVRGTIAMARTSDPHSATAQFFVNVSNNSSLDHQAKVGPGWGYTVFGTVTEGMETVDKIKAVQTGPSRDGQFQKDCPLDPVVINSIKRR
jgi:cyclophilin family peptidyl-prolyl cis-trans isomerase